ncbi:LpxI family protein [Acetobacteraceae bacterium]|nr:LpxI family protein [Acetobacteraceae bacterium]
MLRFLRMGMANLRKVGIIAGGGGLPALLARQLHRQGVPFTLIALEGYANLKILASFSPNVIRLGAVGRILSCLKRNECTELVMIGPVKRPSWYRLCPDLKALPFLWKLGERFYKGDDALLKTIVSLLEQEGFEVKGADFYLPSCVGQKGFNRSLSSNEKKDLIFAWRFLTVTASFDMGQGCVVQNGRILAAEGPEGTDNMLKRVASLGISCSKRAGLLLKKPKVNQEMRVDMPMIGLDTLRLASEAGLAGVAYEAGSTFVMDELLCQQMAAELGLFFGGVKIPPFNKD